MRNPCTMPECMWQGKYLILLDELNMRYDLMWYINTPKEQLKPIWFIKCEMLTHLSVRFPSSTNRPHVRMNVFFRIFFGMHGLFAEVMWRSSCMRTQKCHECRSSSRAQGAQANCHLQVIRVGVVQKVPVHSALMFIVGLPTHTLCICIGTWYMIVYLK